MSDIFIKNNPNGSPGWRKAIALWIKDGTWRPVIGVWIKNATQWLRVWPLSGIFATRPSWIANFASDTYSSRMPSTTYPVIRIGTSYFGNNAQWDLNGWTASRYDYSWKLYDQFGSDLSISLRSGTGSGWTSTTGQDTLPTSIWTSTNSTNSDNQFLRFQATAVNSSNSQYNGVSLSTSIKVIREKPVFSSNSLSTNSPQIGSQITYSSTWLSGEAYKADSSRTIIRWYKNSINSTTGGTLIGTGSTYTPTTNNTTYNTGSDAGFYIYVEEIRYNSGTDYELGSSTGVSATKIITTSTVQSNPDAFTYTISNASSVTTPNTPTQTRVSSTSNDILFEFASARPADTLSYILNLSGLVTNAGNQTIETLNLFSNSSDYQTTLTGSGNVSAYVTANGTTRSYQANVSTTSGAQSWRVNVTYTQGVLSETFNVDTNSMPVRIVDITGATNPNVAINSITAYSGLNQTGGTRAGTAGSPVTLNGLARPTATSQTSTSNYTLYVNNQAAGSQRRVSLPSNFTNGTSLYISTNGYIGIGSDPSGSISIPSSGLYLAPFQGDQRQTALWTLSDANNFYVRWQGARHNDANQTIDYQVKFYWDSQTVDVYFVTNNLSSSNPPSTTAIQNNGVEVTNWSGSSSQSSTLISTSSMTRNTSRDSIDDANTLIVANKPLSAPVNVTLPVISPTTGVQGVTSYSVTNGTWTNSPTSYTYQWKYLDQGSTYFNAPNSIIEPFTSRGSTYRPPSNYVTLYGNTLTCDVVASNGTPSTAARASNVTVTAAAAPFFPFFPPYFPFFPPYFPFFPPYFPFFPPYFPFFPPFFPFFPPYFGPPFFPYFTIDPYEV